MNKTISLIAFFYCFAGILTAQSFNDGLELYEDQQYQEAADIFVNLDDERSVLFAGKSFFGLQKYMKAIQYLKTAEEEATEPSISQEALYTIALSHFRMKNYARSLDLLYEIVTSENRSRVRIDARRFYRQILDYLTLEQRFKAVQQTDYHRVGFDLVSSSGGLVSGENYSILMNQFLETITESETREELTEELASPSQIQSLQEQYPSPPAGMVYNLGVVLPATEDQSANQLIIPRNLYYGILLATEEFNSRNADKKIHLYFKSSGEDPDSTSRAFTELVWAHHADAVIGPLFSETAQSMAKLAEDFRVPMIAPLANSDDINLDYNYTFQMNPTFEIHGKKMAQYAVQDLGLDSLAVISQKDALGTASARSFRYEAERLGAHISYYMEENFSDFGYDLSEFTERFTTDQELIDSLGYKPSDAIYAPFTGQAANTLMNLLMTDLEVERSSMIILGSEEWQNASLSDWQNQNFEIYYSQAFGGTTADTATAASLEEDFETRFGIEADQFAKIGFDVANYVFDSFDRAGNPAYLGEVLRQRPPHEGLVLTINLDNHRINHNIFIRPLSEPAMQRLE